MRLGHVGRWGAERCSELWSNFRKRLQRSFLSPSQPLQQFSVNAAEAAVAEHDNDIAALRDLGDVRDDGIHVRQIRASLARALSSPASAFPGFNRSSGAICSSRATSETTTASASANDSASSVWKTFRRVVFVRGSKTAQIFSLRDI